MFGMEGKKTEGKIPTIKFDIEKDLQDPGKLKAMKEKLDERVKQLKTLLREGADKAKFTEAQSLLNAYLAVKKVIGRLGKKT